jgi:hypothetical protein
MRLAKDAAANDYEKHIMAAEDVTLILLSQKIERTPTSASG